MKKLEDYTKEELINSYVDLVKENEDLKKQAGKPSNKDVFNKFLCSMCSKNCNDKCKFYPKKDNALFSYVDYMDTRRCIDLANDNILSILEKLTKDKEKKYAIDIDDKLFELMEQVEELQYLLVSTREELIFVKEGKLDRTCLLDNDEEAKEGKEN